MRRNTSILLLALLAACTPKIKPPATTMPVHTFPIPFDQNPNQTLTYESLIAVYQQMAAAYPDIFKLEEAGPTDIGRPLHTAVLSLSGEFDPAVLKKSGKTILLINNGIHPGEPEGIDATVLLLRDLLLHPEKRSVLRNTVLVVIPVYNVDGCLNRNAYSRANQNGPESYGFRGNAQNLDLNRDFIKTDTRNAQTFTKIFQRWMPDLFIDNHTSNGADYFYTMTLIATQHNKLEKPLGQFLQEKMLPFLQADMTRKGWPMAPYMDTRGETPETGINAFCDHPRYSTGYAALWNCIGFMPETHMLKPFAERVQSTRAFMESSLSFLDENGAALQTARKAAIELTRTKKSFVLDWKLREERPDSFLFKGYTARYKNSEISGKPRLWYDRSAPWEKPIPYYKEYSPALQVDKPYAYLIPQSWHAVIERLQRNGVQMKRLTQDVALPLETIYLKDFKNRNAWEGHFYHYALTTESRETERRFYKGDYLVVLDQPANRYLVETLEPKAPDSWFAWNFFDAVLGQKEYFSAYVFEDLAAEWLKTRPDVRADLKAKCAEDSKFAQDSDAQLDWVYRRSPWYEPTHRMYPVARIPEGLRLPVSAE